MSGELWRSYFQIAKETTPGTTVAATRRMYFDIDGSRLSRDRDARAHRFATGSRDNVRAFTLGPTVVGGTLKMPLSASELVELLLMTLAGGVTPADSDPVFLWTFTPGNTLDPATLEWYDGARAWEAVTVASGIASRQGSPASPGPVSAGPMSGEPASKPVSIGSASRKPPLSIVL